MSQQELVLAGEQQVAVRQEPLPLAAILEAAQSKDVDAAKMEQLFALYERMKDRDAREQFDRAMNACQKEMPRIKKDGKVINHKTNALQSRYATLERIDEEVRPIYERHGFGVSWRNDGFESGKYQMVAVVRHDAGHREEYKFPLALDQTGAKNDIQGFGSVITYARRYSICAIFNIVTEGQDNDGQKKEPLISQEQADNIDTLLTDQKRDRSKFYAWASDQAGHEVAKLTDIPARLYSAVMQALQPKGAR